MRQRVLPLSLTCAGRPSRQPRRPSATPSRRALATRRLGSRPAWDGARPRFVRRRPSRRRLKRAARRRTRSRRRLRSSSTTRSSGSGCVRFLAFSAVPMIAIDHGLRCRSRTLADARPARRQGAQGIDENAQGPSALRTDLPDGAGTRRRVQRQALQAHGDQRAPLGLSTSLTIAGHPEGWPWLAVTSRTSPENSVHACDIDQHHLTTSRCSAKANLPQVSARSRGRATHV